MFFLMETSNIVCFILANLFGGSFKILVFSRPTSNVNQVLPKKGMGDISPSNFLEGGKKFSFSCLRRLKTWLRPPPNFFVVAEPLM